jgi:hypothetical protein
MLNRFFKIFGSIFLIVILATGCAMYNYDVSIRNVGKKLISNADVSYDGFHSGGGYISPGYGATHQTPGYPIPEKAIVEWCTKDGVLHQKEVEVKKLVPKGFRGTIQFEIDDNNEVTVRFMQDDDW